MTMSPADPLRHVCSALVLLATIARGAAADTPIEDLVLLNGVRSWGAPAGLEIRREAGTPGGWALAMTLPADGQHWFTFDRCVAPIDAAGSVEFDLCVDRAAPGAKLSI